MNSGTTLILSGLQPWSVGAVRTSLSHWVIGFPYSTDVSRLSALPGPVGIALFALAVVLAAGGLVLLARRGRLRPPSRRVALILVLALSVPVGEAVASTIGSNLFGTRNLAASWPAMAICLGAVLVAAGPRLGAAAATLAVAAFAIGGVKSLGTDFRRPDYDGIVSYIDRHAAPGDAVIDGASVRPAGVPSAIDAAFAGRRRVFHLNSATVRYDPFRILAGPPSTETVVRRAAAAVPKGRLFLLLIRNSPSLGQVVAAMPPRYRRVTTRTYEGFNDVTMFVYASRAGASAAARQVG